MGLISSIVGPWSKSNIRIANLSESINMFQETQGKGAAAESILRSIVGTEVVANMQGECRGLYEVDKGPEGFPTLFAVYGPKLFMLSNEGDTYVPLEIYSSFTNYNTPVHMTQTGGSHPHLVIVDGANVIAVDVTLTLEGMRNDIRSIQLPYRVDSTTQRIVPTHVAYTYNYLIVNDSTTDNIYFSHEFPFENTTSNDEIDYDIFMVNSVQYRDYGFHEQASWSPDNVTALISNGTLLYTFGPKSSQIWTNNSDVDAPFVSPTNCANMIGIKAPDSLAIVGDFVFYLGSSAIGENGIYYWRGNQLSRCSTPDVERLIQGFNNPEDAVGQCWMENGHIFYAITFRNDDYTLVYDVLEEAWHRRSTKGEKDNKHHAWRNKFALLHNGSIMFGVKDYIIKMSKNKYTEYDGRPIIRMRRSGALLDSFNVFLVDGIKLLCNTGDFNDANLTPQIMLRYCDQGGPYSNQEIGLLGRQGEYGTVVEWFNLGLFTVMTLEISCSDPIDFAIISAKIQYKQIDSL